MRRYTYCCEVRTIISFKLFYMNSILETMNWRYATKAFDTEKKLSDEQLQTLLDAAILSPSSYGLQPYKMIVVSDPAIRTQLQAAGYGQPQITEASNLVLFAVKTNIDDSTVDEFIALIASVRGVPVEMLAEYSGMIKRMLLSLSPEARIDWATRQAYIALGVMVSAAAGMHIDMGPMEGFDAAQFDAILGLKEHNLTTKVIAVLGFRKDEEEVKNFKKVRFPKSEIVITK